MHKANGRNCVYNISKTKMVKKTELTKNDKKKKKQIYRKIITIQQFQINHLLNIFKYSKEH